MQSVINSKQNHWLEFWLLFSSSKALLKKNDVEVMKINFAIGIALEGCFDELEKHLEYVKQNKIVFNLIFDKNSW